MNRMISRLTAAFHEAGKIYHRMQRTFWPGSQSIIAILPLRSADIRIFRSTGSLRTIFRGRLLREGRTEHYREILDEVARQSSVCERRADEAERESDKLKKAEYMSYHIGEEFEGIISGVTGWGFYVELAKYCRGTGSCEYTEG